jgi:signal transduction histidine kinase/ligand-binding sensor domain-containing protein/DNA-binding response OmpR family regulator
MKGLNFNIALFFLLKLLLLLVQPVNTFGQSLYYSSGQYFEEFSQGFPDANFYSLIQDTSGFIWMGNDGAIVKYDGYKFSVFKPPEDFIHLDKIKRKNITEISLDQYGNLWFGTVTSGLSRFDPETEEFFHYPYIQNAPNSITEGSVLSIACNKGSIWVGTNKGLNRVEFNPSQPDSIKVIQFRTAGNNGLALDKHKLLGNNIKDLYIDKGQNLWIGTDKGLSKLDLSAAKNHKLTKEYSFEHFVKMGDTLTGIHFDNITSISPGLSGDLWIAGQDEEKKVCLDLYTYHTKEFHSLRFKEPINKRITSIVHARNGSLWLATYGEGVKKIDFPDLEKKARKGNLPLVSYTTYNFTYWGTMSTNRIMSLIEDHSGAVWIGTAYCYLFKAAPSRSWLQYHQIPSDLSDAPLVSYAMEDSERDVWLGTTEHGLFRKGIHSQEYENFRHNPANSNSISSDAVNFVFEDRNKKLWIGTKKGLNSYDKNISLFTRYNHLPNAPKGFTYSIYEDRNGILWLSCFGEGLFLFDTQKEKFWHYKHDSADEKSLKSNTITQVFEDHEGTIWVVGFYLHKVIKNKKNTEGLDRLTFELQGVPADIGLVVIHEDRQNRFWGGTGYTGLLHIDPKSGEIVKDYKEKNGFLLDGEGVFSIEEDNEGNLWAFGPSGIQKFDLKNEVFEFFGETSGVSYSTSGRLTDKNKNGWILSTTGKNGYYVFHPDSIRRNKIPPKVLITKFRLFNQVVKPDSKGPIQKPVSKIKNIILKHNQDNFAFEYVALHYDRTKQIQYAYQMEGIDEDWVYVGNERIARYPKLAPGNYKFRVKAANADGVWNEKGASVDIEILKPWWGTWLAYLIYTVSFSGAIVFFYRYQLKNKLQIQEAKRLTELDAVKTKLYTNITHEFRTPLTIILGMAAQIRTNPRDWFSEGLQMIERSGKNLLHLVNQMLDLSKLEGGGLSVNLIQADIIVYLKYLFESFHSMAEGKEIALQFKSIQKSFMMDYDPDKILNIVFNLVSNAIKYTDKGGTITMTADPKQGSEKYFEMSIQDTGAGISAENLPLIFDRFYQASDGRGKAGGTGLGLAIVKELIHLMKGSVSVKSEMGKGTTFTIILPVTRNVVLGEEPMMSGIKEQLPFELAAEGIQQDEKIIKTEGKPLLLIVEDNPDVVTYLSSFLSKDYQVMVGNDGKEGIDLAIENIPDLILSDVMMPVKDGFELCNTLKTDERTSHIPIILLTAKADLSSKFEGLKLGADDYLSKPVIREELELRLRNLMESRKQLQEYYRKIYPALHKEEKYQKENIFMNRLHEIFEANLDDENHDIKTLCRKLNISRMQLHRKIKALTGKSASHYLRFLRLHKAKELLLSTDKSISEIAYDVGFKALSYFSTSFSEEFGQSPKEFRQ